MNHAASSSIVAVREALATMPARADGAKNRHLFFSASQEHRYQVLLHDDPGCFRSQFAADEVKSFRRIEQHRSYVIRREHALDDKLAHQSLQNESIEFAAPWRRCLFDHCDLPMSLCMWSSTRRKPWS